VVSLVMGQLFDFLDFDGDIDLDGDIFGLPVSPLKPIIIMSFITTFGGIGIIALNKGLGSITSLVIALSSGLLVAILLYNFVVVPLYKSQNTSAISKEELIGYNAKTKVSIIGNNFGSITYTINGNTYSAPAKSIDGMDIYVGEEVRIVSIEKNTFYVVRT